MILSGAQIERLVKGGEICIDPFDPTQLKSASYTFTLGNKILVPKKTEFIDARMGSEFEERELPMDGYILNPGDFVILQTREKVTLNNKFACFLSTRGSIAKMGLAMIQSSIYGEPDTDNVFALETKNNSNLPAKIYPGLPVVKGIFSKLAE